MSPAVRRRDRQREETRRDLSVAALELALAHGLRNVRVPVIAEVAGVSTRTFNNYFPSKEAAIVLPARVRTAAMAADLLSRPDDEALGDALIATVIGRYGGPEQHGVPADGYAGFSRSCHRTRIARGVPEGDERRGAGARRSDRSPRWSRAAVQQAAAGVRR